MLQIRTTIQTLIKKNNLRIRILSFRITEFDPLEKKRIRPVKITDPVFTLRLILKYIYFESIELFYNLYRNGKAVEREGQSFCRCLSVSVFLSLSVCVGLSISSQKSSWFILFFALFICRSRT